MLVISGTRFLSEELCHPNTMSQLCIQLHLFHPLGCHRKSFLTSLGSVYQSGLLSEGLCHPTIGIAACWLHLSQLLKCHCKSLFLSLGLIYESGLLSERLCHSETCHLPTCRARFHVFLSHFLHSFIVHLSSFSFIKSE